MLGPLEQVRDHQNPLADTPALVPCQASQLRHPRFAAKKVCWHRLSPKHGTLAESLYHIWEFPEAGITSQITRLDFERQLSEAKHERLVTTHQVEGVQERSPASSSSATKPTRIPSSDLRCTGQGDPIRGEAAQELIRPRAFRLTGIARTRRRHRRAIVGSHNRRGLQPAKTLMVVVPDNSKSKWRRCSDPRCRICPCRRGRRTQGRSFYVHALWAVAWAGPYVPRRSAKGARRPQPRSRPILREIADGGLQGVRLSRLCLCRPDIACRHLGGN